MDPSALTALDALAAMVAGDLASVELVDACIDRIEQLDPVVNAMVIRNFEEARSLAAAADEATARGETTGPPRSCG